MVSIIDDNKKNRKTSPVELIEERNKRIKEAKKRASKREGLRSYSAEDLLNLAKRTTTKKKAKKNLVAAGTSVNSSIKKGEAEIKVITSRGKIIPLSRRESYSKDIQLRTVMNIVSFISKHQELPFSVITKNFPDINPVNIVKALITIEQKGLIKINPIKKTIIKI